MNDDKYRITLTHDDLQNIVSALFEKAIDCERTTMNSVPDEPREQDLCCEHHRLRYNMLKEQKDELRKNAEDTRLLAETLEALIA